MNERHVYTIKVSNVAKVSNKDMVGKRFFSKAEAECALMRDGFCQIPACDLWHNGATEAWIVDKVISTLGVEEVQLR
ncbi:MAG: hypothetical protein K6E61_03320 [Bacteroidales bacterium]|nr:hypothetical protein [Bacteroidales bacterium]